MQRLITASLKVTIKAFDHALNDKAKVTISIIADGKEKESILLVYNKVFRCFSGTGLPTGIYKIHAEAKGLESQEREVILNSGEHDELFILGKKGMPFYYRGKVKVPFQPDEKLIGVTVYGKHADKRENEVLAAAAKFGLSQVETSSHIKDNNVLVFSLAKSDPKAAQEKEEIIKQLENTYGVQLVGPVLEHNKLSVSFLTRQIIVKFRSHIERDRIPSIAKEFDCQVERAITYIGNGWVFKTLRPASFHILDICERLVQSNMVEYAEPNIAFTVVNDFTPNDFLFTQQRHHGVIRTEAAWDITQGDNNIIIAIVDGGFDTTHPDFQNPAGAGWTKIYNPWDFSGMDANPLGINHGVESSGIAAAVSNNAEGIAGVAPGCKLLPVQYPGGLGDLAHSDMYIWVGGFNPHSTSPGFPVSISPGADVIGNSFGIYQSAISGIMKDTFDYLTSYGRNGKGCVIVYSVGNDNIDFNNGLGGSGRQWAAYSRTIAVAASTISPPDPAEIKATTSNFGMNLDICAPAGNTGSQTRSVSSYNVGGGSIAGTSGGGTLSYGSFGQTSCASPEVSGTAALMLSINPNLSWIEVRNILRNTANKIDFANADATGQWVDLNGDGVKEYSQWYGYGRLDAAAAVAGARDFISNSDILVRDNLADTGTVPSSGTFWGSPDLWVRTDDPAIDGALALPANYASAPPHLDADRTHDNWVYVRLKNTGTSPSNNFYVRVYIVHWPGTEFVFPNDFIPANNPGNPVPSPMTPGTYLIGETLINTLPTGPESIINMRWERAKIPPSHVIVSGVDVHWHPCLLVQITPQDGPASTGVHVWDSNNLAQRNITIIGADDSTDDFAVATIVGNLQNSNRILDIEIDRGELPGGVRLYVQVADKRIMEWIEKNQYSDGSRDNKEGCCELQFLNDTKASLRCVGEKGPVAFKMQLPGGSVFHLCNCNNDNNDNGDSGSFTIGNYKGKKVLFLDMQQKIRIPILRAYSRLVPLIVGGIIDSKPEKGNYDITINQFDHKEVISGSYGISLRF